MLNFKPFKNWKGNLCRAVIDNDTGMFFSQRVDAPAQVTAESESLTLAILAGMDSRWLPADNFTAVAIAL